MKSALAFFKSNNEKIVKFLVTLTCALAIIIAAKWGVANLVFKRAEQHHNQLVDLVKQQKEHRAPDADNRSFDTDNHHSKDNIRHSKANTRHSEGNTRHSDDNSRHSRLVRESTDKAQQAKLYKNALSTIGTAINLHNNPQYLEKKAQIIEWGVRLKLEPLTALYQANNLYIESITLRPTWAPTWAALALNKWHLQEFDQDMLHYLVNAYHFGKNSPEVKQVWKAVTPILLDSNLNKYQSNYAPILQYYQLN